MTSFVYLCFVFAAAVFGGLLGIAGHYWRAHATMYAEDLGFNEPLNTLTRDDYQWERYVVGAEWDDAGFWAADSVRNLLYYVLSGVAVPMFFGLIFWGQRGEIVGAVCEMLTRLGLTSPICF